MSPAKKIFFLCLLLILLIILCVNTHLNSLYKKPAAIEEPVLNTQKTEKEIQEPKIEEKIQELEEIKKVEKTEEAKSDNENTTVNESLNDTNKISKEKTEDEPLITTDKRYKRTKNEKPIEELSIEAQLIQIRIRDYVTKYPVTFKNSSYEITKKSLNTIETVMKILSKHPNYKIEIAGHTDAAGKKKYNLMVSVNRAVAVKNQMIKYGFNKNKIKARGYGESIPLVENDSNGYSKVNRRVEFNIIEE